MDEREALRRAVPRQALSARAGSARVLELARELLAIGRVGAERLGRDEARLLEPLDRIVKEARTPAERVLELHARTGGDPAALIPALKIV
jgi:glutamate--cysteine ligase